MQKVIGIGETLFDIVFRDAAHAEGVPGGSAFNAMISLGRIGVPAHFISEIGDDRVGRMILEFMEKNNLSVKSVDRFTDGQTALSVAFLNDEHEAEYTFYRKYPENRLSVVWPRIDPDDIFLFSSYYAVNPEVRQKVIEFLDYARERKTIVFYDPNFRKGHAGKAILMMPSILENLEYADIVRGSKDDFLNIFGESNPDNVYRDKISFYCKTLIYTDGANGIDLYTPDFHKHYPVEKTECVSTIGAGDNFNAGIIFGLIKNGITRDMLPSLQAGLWDEIIGIASAFSKEVCLSRENYIGKTFANMMAQKLP